MIGVLAAVIVGVPFGLTAAGLACRPRPADAILVLGAKVKGAEPGPAMERRLRRAVKLYREGYAPRIVVSGGRRDRETGAAEADIMAHYLDRVGIHPDAVIRETASSDTVENLLFSSRMMKAAGLHSAVLVTSPYHLPRALWLARKVGLEAWGCASGFGNPLYIWLYAWREIPAFWRSYLKWRWLREDI